jgi:hypothetical protein
VHDSTAEGSTTPRYTRAAVTLDMLTKDKKWYEKPMVKVGGVITAEIAVLAVVMGLMKHFHNKNKDD